ncbi:MAG TPA: hypothetical protein VNW46_19880, partial [Gemmatimonadaceae bacterium]|nr:hypothetical protein [Gemmatimonadaceae bacterium]
GAAEIELLALRAAITRQVLVRADSFLIGPRHVRVTADSAARVLAALPKPTLCRGEAERGTLSVSCTSLTDEAPMEIAIQLVMHYHGKYGDISGGGLLGSVHARRPLPFDTLRVLCVGRDTLVIEAPAVERWERDYYPLIDASTPAYNMTGMDGGDGRHSGVIEVLTFSSSADHHGVNVAITMSGNPRERPSDDDRSAMLADRLSGLTLGADQPLLAPALAKVAVMFERQWVSRPMPPMVLEFVNRYAPSGRP